jgi:5'-nucleotidase
LIQHHENEISNTLFNNLFFENTTLLINTEVQIILMKSILIVNDDGIHSHGIRAAAESVKELGKITIVAPSKQNSGVGRSLSLRKPLPVHKEKIGDFEAFSVDGTPVDSVIVAIFALLERKPDLLISGINLGENMSSEITTSGTVCAAIEGSNHEIPSIAISLHLDEEYKFGKGTEVDFTLSKKALYATSKNILEYGLPEGVDLLNINVPDSKAEKADLRVTRLARRMYSAKVKRIDDPSGNSNYLIDGDAIFDAEEGTDVYAVRIDNSISITPLTLDFTAHDGIADLKFEF